MAKKLALLNPSTIVNSTVQYLTFIVACYLYFLPYICLCTLHVFYYKLVVVVLSFRQLTMQLPICVCFLLRIYFFFALYGQFFC